MNFAKIFKLVFEISWIWCHTEKQTARHGTVTDDGVHNQPESSTAGGQLYKHVMQAGMYDIHWVSERIRQAILF